MTDSAKLRALIKLFAHLITFLRAVHLGRIADQLEKQVLAALDKPNEHVPVFVDNFGNESKLKGK